MSRDQPPFDGLVDDIFALLWELAPDSAVYLGRHEYDGKVPDWSTDSVDDALRDLSSAAVKLRDLTGLDLEQERDRRLLLSHIDLTIFEWQDLRDVQRNPMSWVYALDPTLYLQRRYAPPAVRARAIAELLGQARRHLATARERLDVRLSEVAVRWGMESATGLAGLVREDVRLEGLDSGQEAALAAAADAAAAELDAFAGWLEEERVPRADESFPIGSARLERLASLGELVELSIDQLAAMAEADLAANLEGFVTTASELDPRLSPREVHDRFVASVHPPRGGLVAAAEEALEDIRGFIVDRDLITIPSEVRARVAETPKHLRWAFAMMDTPGPYETATEAYYYITPDEPDWPDEKAEEWLRALNTFALEAISVHEAYPGHYVHFLHYDDAPTEVSRRLSSYAFSEGWAHYSEQMMWEEGYRSGDPRFRLAQLAEALVRNCRFVSAIGLHSGEMSVDDATGFFVENAFYEELPARKEAERGTFDPGYFSYTLGKLQILELRADYRRQQGRAYSLKDFHDRLLSRGAPPVQIMREIMVGQ